VIHNYSLPQGPYNELVVPLGVICNLGQPQGLVVQLSLILRGKYN
jgi:hypothetical protein